MTKKIDFVNADIRDWVSAYDGQRFSSAFCDPPYEINFMGSSERDWDRTGVAFDVELWKMLKNHILPGAFGMAFGGTRTYHRLAAAIEDAGFVIHPAIGWLQGQGFPKATRVSSDDSAWSEYRYGLQALKPSFEFVCVFQKPYDGRPLDNIIETGAGALNIDATRIGGVGGVGGRWPSNIIVQHAPECRKVGVERGEGYTINRWTDGAKPFGGGAGHEFEGEDVAETVEIWECVDGCPAKTMNDQAGDSRSPSSTTNYGPHKTQPGANGTMRQGWNGDKVVQGYGDSGGPSRFFFNFQAESLDDGDPVFYCSKASRKERDAGLNELDDQEIKTMQNRVCVNCGKSSLDGRRNGPCCDDPQYESRQVRSGKNPHVAVKPLRLTEYLAKMLLPPDAYAPRRILVPFAGSGSEAIGAKLAGWDEVVGVELSADFVEIAEARARFWLPENRAKQLRLG